MQRDKREQRYDVEVVTSDDLWARFGQPLPELTGLPSEPTKNKLHVYRWGTRFMAVLLTTALHTFLISTALTGTKGRPPVQPLTEGAAASNRTSSSTEFVTVMLLINDHSITPPDQTRDDSAYATSPAAQPLAKDEVLLTHIEVPKPPQIIGSDEGSDENSPSADASGDEAGRAMLFGRYMGQIKARIDRVWEYPQSPLINVFNCKVQIRQSKQGDVLEVTLQRCGDDPAWQISLVQAIQRASPLSAPPTDAVFSDVVTLSFSALTPVIAAGESVDATSLPASL